MTTNSMPHVITGDRGHVFAALRLAQAEGRLVSVTDSQVLPDQRVRVLAHLRTPARSRWEQVRRWLIVAAKAAAVLAAVAAAGALVWLVLLGVIWVIALVTAVIAWTHAHLVGIAVGVVALVLFLGFCLSSGGGCGGMHCGGCRG
jgi:hypothetical protein